MAPGNNRVSFISSEIFKYVRIHPNFTSRPVLCEKMFLCCFFPKSKEKRLDKQAHCLVEVCGMFGHDYAFQAGSFMLQNLIWDITCLQQHHLCIINKLFAEEVNSSGYLPSHLYIDEVISHLQMFESSISECCL